MAKPMISVAIATYNGEKYLREQLDSIYNQSHKDIEVVVSDDCSYDSTAQILEEYRVEHCLDYHVNKKNIGFVKNFEKAILHCSGDYIALSDQDDIWMPDKLEILLSEIDNCFLIYSDAHLIDGKRNIIHKSFAKYMGKPDSFNLNTLLFQNLVPACTALYKRELIQSALPFPDDIMYHDWWLSIVSSTLSCIKYVNLPLISHRLHKDSHTESAKRGGFFFSYFNQNKYRELYSHYASILSDKRKLLRQRELLIIRDLKDYYGSFLSKRIRFRSFLIYIKYFKYFNVSSLFLKKVIYLLMSLLGKIN